MSDTTEVFLSLRGWRKFGDGTFYHLDTLAGWPPMSMEQALDLQFMRERIEREKAAQEVSESCCYGWRTLMVALSVTLGYLLGKVL